MMKTTHRMTFTIPTQMVEAIDVMSRIWKISKSKIVTICLESSFSLLDEGLEDTNGTQPPKKHFEPAHRSAAIGKHKMIQTGDDRQHDNRPQEAVG